MAAMNATRSCPSATRMPRIYWSTATTLKRSKRCCLGIAGRSKFIDIDPPYNTGNEGWVFNDNVNDPRIKKWLGMMYARLARLRACLHVA